MSAEQMAINEAAGKALAEANLQTKPQWIQDLAHANQAFADKVTPLVLMGIAGLDGAGAGEEMGAEGIGVRVAEEAPEVLKGPISDAVPRNLPQQIALNAATEGRGISS